MKSYNHVFEKIIDPDNLRLAIERSSLGKRDRVDVKNVRSDPDKHVAIIQELLITRKYKIPAHELVEINDGVR